MRPLFVGVGALLLLALALLYYVFVALRPAHVASLVPEDFSIGLFYSSVDDLRELYEGPYMRRDLDPGERRVGRRINAPGLDGVSYRNPVGSYFTRDGDEILLVPVTDPNAFEDAFETEREDITLRPPERVSKNYLSLSASRLRAERRKDHPLVLRATEFPLAVAGQPHDAETVARMFVYPLLYEPRQKPQGVPLLLDAVKKLPLAAAERVAAECDTLLVGLHKVEGVVQATVEATLAAEGHVHRGAALARDLDLGALARSFPGDTGLLCGGVLDRDGWRAFGLTLPVGDAAFACGVVETKHRARRFTVLLMARPRDAADLAELARAGHTHLLDDPGAALKFETSEDRGTEVKAAEMADAPERWRMVLRSAAKVPPPVYVATAVENGVWYCALGTQAVRVLRHALGCARGANELSVVGPAGPIPHDPDFAGDRPLAVALVSAAGLAAVQAPMPYFEIASIAQPPAVSLTLHAEDAQAHGRIVIGK